VKVWDTRQQKAVGQFAPFVDFVSDICHVPFGAGAGEQKIDATDPDAPGTSAQGASQGVNTHPGSLVVTSGDGTIAHLSLHNWKGTALRVSQIPASLFDHTRLTLFFYNERARAERHA
jgi:hypothetical protein